MRVVSLEQPRRLVFGQGCLQEAIRYVAELGLRPVHIVTSHSLATTAEGMASALIVNGCETSVDALTPAEPTFTDFESALARAEASGAQCIVGLGGGSVLDIAKLLAALTGSNQRVEDVIGIGFLFQRKLHLVCLPTTSGTGSEVSPNALLLDAEAGAKKGIISPFLVPDATFIDPLLTRSMPPSLTAYTGLDALTHCIEAYTNRFSHPVVDVFALKGISLCAQFLERAVRDGNDLEAREAMSLASYYGGCCLGPVNTAANHALAYPLGGEYRIAHGLSNAILLAAVYRFNALAVPQRYADVARALDVRDCDNDKDASRRGALRLEEIIRGCGIDVRLGSHGVPRSAIPGLARSALTVTRLLRNNPREVTMVDAETMYAACFGDEAAL